MAKQKQPPGEPMDLGNMRHLGVRWCTLQQASAWHVVRVPRFGPRSKRLTRATV